ncbi:MAG TPA: hypothetical protein VFN21_13705 [Acidimicrobiales bacterium]|nr:hypothetical protein [Acidimicrobiales bacterium]
MIQSRGRVRGIIALIIVVVIVLAIAVLAGSNASYVMIGVIAALLLLGAIMVVVGKRRTGLSITPEWKPEPVDDDYDDLDDADERDAAATADVDQPERADDADVTDGEPIRRLDAQILGADLSKLGQVISPKLAKSYAVGTLVLEGSDIMWEPGAVSRAAGIEDLVTAPEQVSTVEAAPLWGSWGLVRVATTGGDEWCMRVPGSVDLSPAFAELGLTLHKTSA